jgi:signal transduction histidine kinase
VVSTLALDELLTLITKKAVDLLDASGGVLNLVDWDESHDEVVASTGSVASALGFRSPLEGSLSGWVALNKKAVLVNDVGNDARIDQMAYDFLTDQAGVPVRTTAAAPLSIKDQVLGSLVVMDKHEGRGRFAQADLDLLISFASQAAAAIENARLFEAELRRAEQFQVISEVSRRMTSIMALDELLAQIVDLIQRTFGYYIVEIALVEDGELSFQAGRGGDWNFRPGQFRLPIDQESVTGAAAATGEAQLVPDIQADARYVRLFDTRARSELAVPLMTKEEVIGVLNVESDRQEGFDEIDVNVLGALANQAAVAIENARLYARAQQVAAVEERQRIARDLHDAVTQTLFSSTLIAEVLPRLWERDHEEGMRRLEELRQLTRGALAEMRTLLVELMPAALADADLPDLMRQLSEATTGRARVPVQLKVEGHRPLPSVVKVSLYRIAQEALNNVAKHSAASGATLALHYADTSVLLRVADDGRGFDPESISAEHLGLSIMRERAEDIGAEIRIYSEPGVGTEITVVWSAAPAPD